MKPIITTITDDWIKQNNPCKEAIYWWDKKERDPIKILKLLIKDKKYDWANWFIVRIMTYHDYVSYAVYAAEQMIDIYEKEYPHDKRPREAIEAAKRCIKNPIKKNKKAAYAAAQAACAVVYAVACAVADAGACAVAYAAAYAVAYAAADAVADAAYTTAYVAADATMQLKILNYGMKLLKAGER